MNDRFKYRVWDKRRNKYIESPEPTPLLQANGLLAYFKDAKPMENYVIQFCTGLKDKNGKLIYEGDIVKDDHEALHYVKWVYDSWQLFPCSQNNYTIGIVDDEIETIGNIYENADILKG